MVTTGEEKNQTGVIGSLAKRQMTMMTLRARGPQGAHSPLTPNL